MIRFDNWLIHADGEIIARQFDNLTRTLTVVGDIPAGWEDLGTVEEVQGVQ